MVFKPIDQELEQDSSQPRYNENDMSCMSLATTLKALNPQKKMYCKLQVQQILFSVQFSGMSQTAMPPNLHKLTYQC